MQPKPRNFITLSRYVQKEMGGDVQSLLDTWVDAYLLHNSAFTNAEAVLRGVLYTLRLMAKPRSFIPELIARCLVEMNGGSTCGRRDSGCYLY